MSLSPEKNKIALASALRLSLHRTGGGQQTVSPSPTQSTSRVLERIDASDVGRRAAPGDGRGLIPLGIRGGGRG